jgi:hypothetical protein
MLKFWFQERSEVSEEHQMTAVDDHDLGENGRRVLGNLESSSIGSPIINSVVEAA